MIAKTPYNKVIKNLFSKRFNILAGFEMYECFIFSDVPRVGVAALNPFPKS